MPQAAARPCRVVFVIQKLAGLRGGAERVLIETAEAMAARGMDVSIASYDRHGGAPAYPCSLPVIRLWPGASRRPPPVHVGHGRRGRAEALLRALPNGLGLGRLKYALTHGLFARRLRAHLRATRPDVVVAFLPPAILAAAEALRGWGAGAPALIASVHNVPAAEFDDGSPRWDNNPVYRRAARAALHRAARITILQPDFAAWFAPGLQDRLVVMPNPVRRLSPPVTEGGPGPARAPLILGVGRLTSVKRFDLLLRAFARIAADLPDWRLDIHGDGPERARLAALITDLGLEGQARLAGVTPDLGPVYDRAAILAHPAAFEGFGLSVAEAMAHGLPPVAFADCAGVNRLITDGQDGLLVQTEPAADPDADPDATPDAARAEALAEALAGALAGLIADPARRALLGARATGLALRLSPEQVHAAWAAEIAATHEGRKGND